jgi:hypothetical protein
MRAPVQLERNADLMCREVATKGSRGSLVGQDSHSRDFQGLGRMFQHATGLLRRDARKPLQKVLDRRAIFNVLEQRGHGHASTAKNPRAADAISVALDGRARGPVNHYLMLLFELRRSTVTQESLVRPQKMPVLAARDEGDPRIPRQYPRRSSLGEIVLGLCHFLIAAGSKCFTKINMEGRR